MNIDRSKAPEGATHAGTMKHASARQCWYKRMPSGGWRYSYGERWEIVAGDPGHVPLIELPAGWAGEGLPPVGTVCEFKRNSPTAAFTVCTILCLGDRRVFFRDGDDNELSRSYSEVEFRPIRTPEQIAAEERRAEVEELTKIIKSMPYVRDHYLAERLYCAGYRKQVQP